MAISYTKKENIEVVVVEPDETQYQFKADTPKEKEALVKKIERAVRSSLEYADYITFLRQNVGMDACAFYNNVNKKSNRRIRIEVHHTPLTLFDIAKLVLDKFLLSGEELDDLLIAEEVTRIHYMNQVGLIPLSKTLHEVAHRSDKLIIPIYMIFGNYAKFLKDYADVLELEENEAILQKLERVIEQTKEITDSSFDVLKERYTYVKVDGFSVLTKIDDEKEVIEEVEKNQKKKVA